MVKWALQLGLVEADSIPARSCYLSELSRSILPLLDRLLSHHAVTTPEEFILHSYGWISGERFPWPGESPELDSASTHI